MKQVTYIPPEGQGPEILIEGPEETKEAKVKRINLHQIKLLAIGLLVVILVICAVLLGVMAYETLIGVALFAFTPIRWALNVPLAIPITIYGTCIIMYSILTRNISNEWETIEKFVVGSVLVIICTCLIITKNSGWGFLLVMFGLSMPLTLQSRLELARAMGKFKKK